MIERDAISLVWLQCLQLPRIVVDDVPEVIAPYWERYQRSARELEYMFFDATTDVGVFTVYALQIAHADQRVMNLVSCAADVRPDAALAKIIRDMAHIRMAFHREHPIPTDWDDYGDVLDGATFMARRANAGAFEFLVRAPSTIPLSSVRTPETANDRSKLQIVIEHLRRMGCEIYAVDLTTDEAVRSGMVVVRVLIPRLQPLSFHYRARFLGHPRLYDAPARMGCRPRLESDLNPYPQPFA